MIKITQFVKKSNKKIVRNKKNFVKNPAKGGTPAKEKKISVTVQANTIL